MDELVARVAAAAEISTEQAARAVGIVFAFLAREAPDEFAEVCTHIPGAAEAAAAGEADKPKPGLMGTLMGKIGGGGLMALASQLTATGLGTGEMMAVGRELLAFARERAGDDSVERMAQAVPGFGTLM